MKTAVKKIMEKTIASISLMIRVIRGVDHKILNHYMLKINQMQDLDSIIYQASRCLHYILNYRLFAFAVYDREYNGGVDVWVDPRMDNGAIMNFIKKDFSTQNLCYNIRFIDHASGTEPLTGNIDQGNILSYKVIDNQTRAVLYLLPRRMILHYHSELLDIIIKTVTTAVSTIIYMKKLENAALIDPLTHCYNRRSLAQHIEHEIANADRYGRSFSVVMLDIDHFKQINDTYGHKAGDAVLTAVSKSIFSAIRKSDYLFRYGGEEFLILFSETNLVRAIETSERIRRIIENVSVDFDSDILRVTTSLGVATYKKGLTAQALFEKADKMMYRAKREGRNCVRPDLRLCENERVS